ncbi:MAG: membrane-bound lytic murein transglycosylase MltF [Thiotrichales bacterium]|nr:MAG: membrane-bound lytic murein transglycosylase MltF [Thiotrichales bacterium]
MKLKPFTGVLFIIAFGLFIASCSDQEQPTQIQSQSQPQSQAEPQPKPEPQQKVASDLLDQIIERNELIVLTTNQPTTYYIDREDKPAGPEFDMAQSFAQSLGVNTRYVEFDSTEAVIAALRKGEGDIAAAGLTITDERGREFDFGPAYMDISEYLVCHRDSGFVSEIDDLRGREIVIPAETSYADTLYKEYPGVDWNPSASLLTPALLEKVRDREIECTVSDSTIFDINRRYYPEISVKFTLHKGSQLAWMYPRDNPRLDTVIHKWFIEYQQSGAYDQDVEKYYGHIEVFDYVDIQKFKRRIKGRLPKYKEWFIQAAEENGIRPGLLAAQSYQESHWNPKAKSPTGVRGIMMLTQPVAKSLGVTSRLDAKQNIFAGAKYHAKMKNMFDEEVTEPDRTWMALAAYNVGRGHFRDAQGLARKLGKSPYHWIDMKEVLPLLAEKEYYKDLRYGYARGNEPVQYVTRIRDYDDILVQHFLSQIPAGEGSE